MTSKMRRASLDTIERMVKDVTETHAQAARNRRLSLTMMNCIWARNTDEETVEPVVGEMQGRRSVGFFYREHRGLGISKLFLFLLFLFLFLLFLLLLLLL